MSLWRQVTHGLRTLLRRDAEDAELAEEVDHFFDERLAWHVERGLSAEAARRAVRHELGDRLAVREDVRAHGWENAVATVAGDVRIGLRRMRARPAFAAVCVLSLALGIGAATSIFSVVRPVLLASLPYPDADRLVMLWDRGADGGREAVTFGTLRELSERGASFSALAVTAPWQPTLTEGTAERLAGQRVSADWFRVLGVPPAEGRDLESADDRPGAPRVALIAHSLRTRRFAAAADVVGRTIELDGVPFRIVGVLPRTLDNVLSPDAEIWTPLQYDPALPPDGREWGHHLRMIGRLRTGVGLDAARSDVAGIAAAPVAAFARPAWASLERGLIVNDLQHEITEGIRPLLLAVIGAVLLLIASAAVNVAGLLLARGVERRGEYAVRAALGAGTGRITAQVITESILLALLGGAGALVVAALGIRALTALGPVGLPRLGAIVLDRWVLVFAILVTMAVGILIGLLPAKEAARARLQAGLRRAARGSIGAHAPARRTLVVVQVALAIVLLIAAGLMLRSVARLLAVDTGFRPVALTMQIQTPHVADDVDAQRFFERILTAVRAVPGVVDAGLTSQLPLTGDADVYGARFESAGGDVAAPAEAFRYTVSAGYLEAMGVEVRAGRPIEAGDGASAAPIALVSESLARSAFPGADPIGRQLTLGRTDLPPATVVGIVADVKQTALDMGSAGAVYVPAAQWYFADRARWLVVRGRGDAGALLPAVRTAIRSVDANLPVVRIATMEERVLASTADRRFALIAFRAFALVALVLAAIGVHGLLATSVAARTSEIGVRSALGATRTGIVMMVLREALSLTAAGVVIGVGAALAGTRLLDSLLFDVAAVDPPTYAAVLALFLLVCSLAAALPARRATRIDPAITLRE